MRWLASLFLLAVSISDSAILFKGSKERIREMSSLLGRHPASYHHSRFHAPSTKEHLREKKSPDEWTLASKRDSPPTISSFFGGSPMQRRGKSKRSISNAVIESAHCEHVDLVDCSEYSSEEVTCMMTATGMTCCVCSEYLQNMNKWKVFG